ncbi:MAG: DUF3109 family protein [Ignavibacteriae bacterium]|nr:DUF3109 family protein [Ignavibacteriota bacterium]
MENLVGFFNYFSLKNQVFSYRKVLYFDAAMFIIGEVRVETQVGKVEFACDLKRCKGACCTMPGGRGAPLLESEIPEIERAFPVVRKYLPVSHLQVIQEQGMYEGFPGYRATMCVDEGACVFVYYDDDIARCSLERAFLNGETVWKKPISCHLFPVRVSVTPRTTIRYEEIESCKPALERGKKEEIPLFEFLKEPLVRSFGEAWYQEFHKTCKELNQG